MKDLGVTATKKNFLSKFIYYSIATLLICVLQLSFSFLISIKGVTPDFIVLLVIWITLYEGKLVGLSSAFLVGLLYDYLSMNVLGVNALTKTIVAYIVGFFYKENEFWNILKSNKIFFDFISFNIYPSYHILFNNDKPNRNKSLVYVLQVFNWWNNLHFYFYFFDFFHKN